MSHHKEIDICILPKTTPAKREDNVVLQNLRLQFVVLITRNYFRIPSSYLLHLNSRNFILFWSERCYEWIHEIEIEMNHQLATSVELVEEI